MRDYITIGELAALLKVSTHQIRYFEEKKVLVPQYIDENGYRMYGLNEIYTLAHILLLRKFDIPVADIKRCFDSFSKSEYMTLLKSSIDKIDEQIKALTALRDYTNKIIDEADSRITSCNQYKIKYMEERKLHQIREISLKSSFTAKQLYDDMQGMRKAENVYEMDIINLYDSEQVYICTEAKENYSPSINHILIGGEYLCYDFYANDENEFEMNINKFIEYSGEHSLNLSGKLIAIENSMLSMFDNNSLYYELQMLIV